MGYTKHIKQVLFMFALSNMAALIYQISWTKSLSYVFGTSVYAVGTVLACFMAGLALGSFVFGKQADKSPAPLRLFAYVELSLGLFALFLIPVFSILPQAYASLHGLFEGKTHVNFLLFALSFQVLIIPTSLIGGTFPIMNRIYSRQIKTIGEDVGVVYSVDTVFAAIGALSAGFFLLPVIGISKSVALGAVINIAAGLYLYKKSCNTGWILHLDDGDANENRNKIIKPVNGNPGRTDSVVFASFFLSGFAALAIEVVWIRFFSLTLGTSVYAISIITASFLIGLSLGSFLISKYSGKIGHPVTALAFVEMGIAMSGIMVLFIMDKLDVPYLMLYHAFDSYYPFTISLFSIIFIIILIPTTLMGATMPLVGKIVSDKFEFIGADIGAVYSINTFGAIFGTIFASFVLVPRIGMIKTGLFGAAIGVSIALMLFAVSERRWMSKFYSFAGTTIILGIYLASVTINPLFAGAYYHGTQLKDIESWNDLKSKTELVRYEEGLYGLVSVVKKDEFIALRIDGKSESSNVPIELVSEHQLAYIPVFASHNPKNVMLIGLGGGFTLDALTNFDEIESIDLVEINPQIIEVVSEEFSAYNNNAIGDPRINIVIGDGRNHLAASEKKYDVIISQPSNIWLSGEGGLFTKEMYSIAKDHLEEGGIFGQWMPLYEQDAGDFRIFLATFSSVFPYTNVWIVGYDAILVGSAKPVVYDYGNIRNHLDSNRKINSDFEMMSDVLATTGEYRLLYQVIVPYRMSGSDVKDFSGGVINTDDRPILEFSSARNTIYQQNVKKPFGTVNGFLKEKYNLVLSPQFTNLTTRHEERIVLDFIDLEAGLDNSWKEESSKINVDHGRNVIYMEAVYSRDGAQFSVLAFPLPDQPLTSGMKEDIIRSMKADASAQVREITIDGHRGYEVKSASGGGYGYAVSWFCEHKDILYSIELRGVADAEGREIIEALKCLHY